MKPSEILRAARAKIATPERWTKGQFARDATGYWVSYDNSDAVGWCAEGAVYAVLLGHVKADDLFVFLDRASGGNTPFFNDAPSTTHADVMAMFDRAIALAEAEEVK
jgi:hypothetical protein